MDSTGGRYREGGAEVKQNQGGYNDQERMKEKEHLIYLDKFRSSTGSGKYVRGAESTTRVSLRVSRRNRMSFTGKDV